jgi:hypothetical protein
MAERKEPAAVTKCGKISVMEEFKNNMPFLTMNSLRTIHSGFESGTTKRLIQKHLIENYEMKIAEHIGDKRETQKTLDNMLSLLRGKRGLGIPVIYSSKGKYRDPALVGKGRVLWFAFDEKAADEAGRGYEEQVKREAAAKREQAWEKKQIERYKNRLLDKTKRFKRLEGEKHGEIVQRALEEVVDELLAKGMDRLAMVKVLNVDRKIKKDLLDMGIVEGLVDKNMKEAMANIMKDDLKDLNKKSKPVWCFKTEKNNPNNPDRLDREQREFIRDGHMSYIINKIWEQKVKEAIERRSCKFFS